MLALDADAPKPPAYPFINQITSKSTDTKQTAHQNLWRTCRRATKFATVAFATASRRLSSAFPLLFRFGEGAFTSGVQRPQAENVSQMTIFATSTRNVVLCNNALTLATRLPKFQANDLCADRAVITDPNSGISFELTMWPGQRMVKYEISIAYGMTMFKPEHAAIIIG